MTHITKQRTKKLKTIDTRKKRKTQELAKGRESKLLKPNDEILLSILAAEGFKGI